MLGLLRGAVDHVPMEITVTEVNGVWDEGSAATNDWLCFQWYILKRT